MNHKQKIGYTILGAFIMLIGMLIDNFISPPVTAQSNGIFGEIQCTGLTVVDKEGRTLIELKNDVLGGAINLYNLGRQVMMSLAVNQMSSKIDLFHKSFGASTDDDSETPTLGIEIDSGPSSNWLHVGNRNSTGGIFMHNMEGFSELNVYHRNGKGGTVLHSSEGIHSLSIYDAYHRKSPTGLSSKKLIGLGSYGGSPKLFISDKDETEVVRLATGEYGGQVDVYANKKGGAMSKSELIDKYSDDLSKMLQFNTTRASMSITEHGGRIDVFNKQGKSRAVMGVNEYGNGAVSTWDKNGYRQ